MYVYLKCYILERVSFIAIRMIFPQAGSVTGLAAGEEPSLFLWRSQ